MMLRTLDSSYLSPLAFALALGAFFTVSACDSEDDGTDDAAHDGSGGAADGGAGGDDAGGGDDGGGAASNVGACESFFDAIECGDTDFGMFVRCDDYSGLECDVTAYFDCLEDNFTCNDGIFDPTAWQMCTSLATCQ